MMDEAINDGHLDVLWDQAEDLASSGQLVVGQIKDLKKATFDFLGPGDWRNPNRQQTRIHELETALHHQERVNGELKLEIKELKAKVEDLEADLAWRKDHALEVGERD